MRKNYKQLIFAVGLIAFSVVGVCAQELRGRVVSVADGDTITVLDSTNTQHKIRLNGIDAPESKQDFGQVSKRNLSDLVFGKDVTVRWSKMDKYRRIVGTVFVGGTNANLEQLKGGFAWYYRQYERDVAPDLRNAYERAEADARAARRGLWSQPNPQPPWEFRHPEQAAAPAQPTNEAARIIGNKNSMIFHAPNCPDYNKVSERNRVYFGNEAEAKRAGYRKARNCP